MSNWKRAVFLYALCNLLALTPNVRANQRSSLSGLRQLNNALKDYLASTHQEEQRRPALSNDIDYGNPVLPVKREEYSPTQPEYPEYLDLPQFDKILLRPGPKYSYYRLFVEPPSFPEIDARGFHESVFDGIGGYYGNGWHGRRKRSADDKPDDATRDKRSINNKDPMEISIRGFHDDVFDQNFGYFYPMKRGQHHAANDAGNRFKRSVTGDKKPDRLPAMGGFPRGKRIAAQKRRPEMDVNGFYGDLFDGGFGQFDTMKKRMHSSDANGFHSDAFTNGFGDWSTMKKRRPEMDASGFHGDAFTGGFGSFDTMKKRRPEMDANGFHGDAFSSGFGSFDTMKRNYYNDPYGSGWGFSSQMYKKNRNTSPVANMWGKRMYNDPYGSGWGFYTNKRNYYNDPYGNGWGFSAFNKRSSGAPDKRKPEMDANGFYGDAFDGGFGDFDTMKRRIAEADGVVTAVPEEVATKPSLGKNEREKREADVAAVPAETTPVPTKTPGGSKSGKNKSYSPKKKTQLTRPAKSNKEKMQRLGKALVHSGVTPI